MNLLKLRPFSSAILFLVVLASCGTTNKAIVSEAPRSLPGLPPSQINIPVKIYLKPLLTMMDSSTAKQFTSDKWPDYYQASCDFRYKYRFIRSPFTFSCVNNRVNISFRGYYQIAGSRTVCAFDRQVSPWVSGSCGFGNEQLRRVDINITSLLELLPGHQVRTSTVLNKLQPLDKCEVTLLKNDMTPEIMDSIRASVETYTKSFDRFVQDLNRNAFLQDVRSGGSRVMPISSYGFLNLNPSAIRVGRLNYIKDSLSFTIGYTGTPQFSSDSMRIVTRASLPLITNVDAAPTISTYLNAVYDYSFFNKILNDSLKNKPFEVQGRTFVINAVEVRGTNTGAISLDIAFSGNRRGVLKLTGTPVLDTARQLLSMPDLKFDVDTRDMLVNIAEGLFRKKIMKKLQDKSVLDIAALIERNKTAISARLNQPVTEWLSTKGRFNQLKIIGLLPQKDHIQLQVYINADLQLVGSPTPADF